MADARPTNGPEKVTNTPDEMKDLKPMNKPQEGPKKKKKSPVPSKSRKGKEVVKRNKSTIYR